MHTTNLRKVGGSVMLAVPLAICVYYNAWPPITAVSAGALPL